MNTFSLGHLADRTLLLQLSDLVSRDRATTAALLAHLAEVDERRLYAPAGYESMYAYCIGELHMSEDEACTRIRASRVARRFPAVFPSLADGRLNLTGLIQLSTRLDETNAENLIAAAAHRTKPQIEQLLAERFPRPDVASAVFSIASEVGPEAPSVPERMNDGLDLVLEPAGSSPPSVPERMNGRLDLVPEPADSSPLSVPERMNSGVDPSIPPSDSTRSRVQALSPQRYAVQFMIDQETRDDLAHAQALCGHQIAPGDLPKLFGRALKALIREIEKRKFAATSKPRAGSQTEGPSSGTRYVPADIRRAVHERDGGRCTFVSDTGHQCESRSHLEFDHIEPVARGGKSTLANIRLRCRAHNQFEAERALGAEFMRRKRSDARSRRVEARDTALAEQARAESAEKARAAAEQVRAAAEAQAAADRAQAEVIPWLRQMGFRADEARRAAKLGGADPGMPLEQRIRQALRHLAPAGVRFARFAANPT
jgi:5-methylcytosine-specific restriction endonuclease McrA